MILDTNMLFSDAQAITVTAVSTNVIDLGADRDLGVTSNLDLIALVGTAFLAAGAATLQMVLQTDDNLAFSSPVTLVDTGAIPKATLVAGYDALKLRLPQVTERYLRVSYTVATGPMTAGTLTAAISPAGKQKWRAYDAVTGV